MLESNERRGSVQKEQTCRHHYTAVGKSDDNAQQKVQIGQVNKRACAL